MTAPPISERHLPHFHRRSPMKEAVRAATTASITISTALNNGDSLDGISLATGDRVLVKDQSTDSQNGIYVVGASPARDYDESIDDPSFGYLVFVREGTANGGTLWKNTNTSAPTVGSTSVTFAQFTTGVAAGPVTTSGLTQTSARLLGRTTASTGAIEEITVGSGLTLSAGSLTATGGGSGTVTTVEEVDGSPTDSAVTKIVFPNGTLSITSHVATYTPTGSGSFTTYDSLIGAISGLVHRWKFEEASGNFADSVGSLTLTASGAFTYSVSGGPVSGGSGSVTFGASGKGTSSGLGSIPVTTAARTFVLVFKGKDSSSKQALYSYGVAGAHTWIAAFLNDNEGNVANAISINGFGAADDSQILGAPINAEVWHMFAVTWDATSTITMFLDGMWSGKRGAAWNTTSSGNFIIGQDTGGSNQLGAVTYDDLAIFSRALQPYEIQQLFNALVGALP